MKQKIFLTLILVITIFTTGCANNQNKIEQKIENNTNKDSESKNNRERVTNINVTINGKIYNARLEENETAQTFAKILPQEFNMNELNGNEKYIYLEKTFPINPSNPSMIEAGDIMLYSDNCLVMFYKTFETTYHYTKIGHITDLPNLGSDNVTVKFGD